jgi:hypothetical protein
MVGIIDAFHTLLLQKKLCIGCTNSLNQSVKRENIDSEVELVTCRCGRHYIYEKTTEVYKKISEEEYERYQGYLHRRKSLKT